MSTSADLLAALADRDAALAALDMDWARRMMPQASDAVRVLAMHKARYECTRVAPELRTESGTWLRERGCTRMDNSAVLPAGELPQ